MFWYTKDLQSEVEINSIEIFEVEEDINLGFDTKNYLPQNFVARKGMFDLDWNTIELFEIEEEVTLGFDTKSYLPKNFNAYKGMSCNNKGNMVIASY